MDFTPDKFNKIKHDAEDFYSKIGFIYCPYFSQKISFNTKGSDHLIFKSWNRTRSINDQFARFRHIELAPRVIENSKTPVWTIVTGCAMSCGFMMLICGHRRFAHKLSTPLYHQVSSGGWGTLKELEANLEETKRLQKILEKITLEKTEISKARLKEVFEQKIDWLWTQKKLKN